MPTISRAKRQKARVKRSNSVLRRALTQSAFQSNKNFGTVLMLLAQAGGEVTVSAETIQSVIPKLQTSSYAAVNTPEGVRIYVVEKDGTEQNIVEAGVLPTETIEEIKARMDAQHNETSVPKAPLGLVTAELQAAHEAIDPTDAALDPA